jgi:hypothetical protein
VKAFAKTQLRQLDSECAREKNAGSTANLFWALEYWILCVVAIYGWQLLAAKEYGLDYSYLACYTAPNGRAQLRRGASTAAHRMFSHSCLT